MSLILYLQVTTGTTAPTAEGMYTKFYTCIASSVRGVGFVLG